MNDDRETIHIDGSQGEGGGQIVRSSLALALVTGRAVTIEHIRAGRKRPGLMRQHLTAVRAAASVGAAEVNGDAIGSRVVKFRPRAIQPGQHRFSVGTAGSATLVLQTVLPALMIADGPSTLTLEGGTHNPWAPPFDFLDKVYFPLVRRMGPNVAGTLERHGFYPAGGGQFTVTVDPCHELRGFDLHERGEVISQSAVALVANLPAEIGRREMRTVQRKTGWPTACLRVAELTDSAGPGNAVLIEVRSRNVTELFTSFGRRGVKAERVASDAVKQMEAYRTAGVPVGSHLADQLMLPLGIAAWQRGHGGSFLTLPLTQHALTHLEVLRRFLDIPARVENAGNTCVVTL